MWSGRVMEERAPHTHGGQAHDQEARWMSGQRVHIVGKRGRHECGEAQCGTRRRASGTRRAAGERYTACGRRAVHGEVREVRTTHAFGPTHAATGMPMCTADGGGGQRAHVLGGQRAPATGVPTATGRAHVRSGRRAHTHGKCSPRVWGDEHAHTRGGRRTHAHGGQGAHARGGRGAWRTAGPCAWLTRAAARVPTRAVDSGDGCAHVRGGGRGIADAS
ncbi:hypothetical protein GGX14DRAFT_405438 [Mycena pura]|uniref:Uncharacterized protein n=1 Tax=Mycena pura TaxID=153505 RepID=A0AAD6XZ76_9AGAR|nr:hypothetical protein GGX14DRAFT_405438 [Mycena pura]